MSVLTQVKEQYHIGAATPVGRVDWAINDFIASNELSLDDKNLLVLATAQEIKEAK